LAAELSWFWIWFGIYVGVLVLIVAGLLWFSRGD